MAGYAVGEGARYRAFISYSHKDAGFGRRLHRRLEAYRLPRRLVGRATPFGPVPERIAPIFRDLDELPAASDLSTEVREALKASASLVVVCSPAAAASQWVSREVEAFRALHPDRPVLAAIVAGEPPGCFPAALLSGGPDGAIVEPLAADFRDKRDGADLALLKLVAGILGVGLDELVQRDAQRRAQRVTAVTAASLAAVVVMGALTTVALSARQEAERQRGEAEGLVEYMLTDLRDRLKGVGRLDVMTAVNERALKYYSDENLAQLPVDSLERRARILHAMGEDDEARGDHEAALAKFREARRTTAALLAQAPNDPERIFDHAQSEFWIAYVDYQRRRYDAAESGFLRYKALADRLVASNPRNTRYRREAAYADGNLCSVNLEKPSNPKSAVRYCKAALDQMETVRRIEKESNVIDEALINRHAWLADAFVADGALEAALSERATEERILIRLMAADPQNADLKDSWISHQRALARLEILQHHVARAVQRLESALSVINTLLNEDPSNHSWAEQRDRIMLSLKHFEANKERGMANERPAEPR